MCVRPRRGSRIVRANRSTLLDGTRWRAVTLPMVVLAMGLGNVEGLGFLLAQGYRVPVTVVTLVAGINSVVNAVFGGHPAIVARTG